jgi:hypothetical protein
MNGWRETPESVLESRLSEFFRAQVPKVWPFCPVEGVERERPLWRSRLVLAASVVLLLLGQLWLSSLFRGGERLPAFNATTLEASKHGIGNGIQTPKHDKAPVGSTVR